MAWPDMRVGSPVACFSYFCFKLNILSSTVLCCYLYVVSTLRLAAAKSIGGIQAGNVVPETHFVHSNKPGSTRIFRVFSCCIPERISNGIENL